LTSSNSASCSPRGPKVGPIPTMRRSLPRTPSGSRATYGCSAAIDCCAATAQWRPTLSACSAASRRTLWSALTVVFLLYQKGRDSPSFRTQGFISGTCRLRRPFDGWRVII
jgi:hypothetical protein